MNYLSWWIENLGVVPLFLLAAFLLVPCFFLLFFLITLSCLVCDAIIFTFKIRSLNFSQFTYIVKALLITAIPSFSQSEIFMSKGEQYSIPAKSLQHFSIGNNEVISARYLKREQKLYIKGKRMGFSDILIKDRSGKKHLHLYVISKREGLKNAKILLHLKKLQIAYKTAGNKIFVTQKIGDLVTYQEVFKVINENQKEIINQTTLSKKLINTIISRVYGKFYEHHLNEYSCKVLDQKIHCKYFSLAQNKALEDEIKKQYHIKLSHFSSNELYQNYKLTLKLFEIQRSDGREIKLGLYLLKNSLMNFIDHGAYSLIKNNQIKVQDTSYKIKTIAEPEVRLILNSKGKIRIGESTPFINQSRDILQTNWKDSGFIFSYHLKSQKEKLVLKYQIDSTKNQGSTISGSSIENEKYVQLNSKFKILFDVLLRTKKFNLEAVPLVNKIPILGRVFSSKSEQRNHKYIMGIYKLETAYD